MSLFDTPVRGPDGAETTLEPYRGRVLLIVNVASKCGFTPQYAGLEKLHRDYAARGLTVLGFPCNQFLKQEPGTDGEIQSFCAVNYGVSFPVFAKVDVNGANTHPLFQFLKTAAPGTLGTTAVKWNFTKFLVDRTGVNVRRFGTATPPSWLAKRIESLL